MTITYHSGNRLQGLSTDTVETPTFSDDFTSYANQTAVDAVYIPLDNTKIAGDTTNDRLNFNAVTDGTNDSLSMDLTSVSDSAWILRFRYSMTAQTKNGAGYEQAPCIGISSADRNTPESTAQDSISFIPYQDNLTRPYRLYASDGTRMRDDNYVTNFTETATVGDDYYIELKRTSTTSAQCSIYSNSIYTTLVETKTLTILSTVTGLRYFVVKNLGSTTNQSGSQTGWIDNIEFYNGVTSVNSKPTNVPNGSRFEETDTRKIYYNGLPISTTGLKAYWKMNEASGTLVNSSPSADTLGTSADSSSTANLTYAQTGKIGNAISFNGTTSSSKAVIGSSTSQFNFMHSTTAIWSVNFWYKKTATDTNDYRTILSNHAGGGNNGTRITFNNTTYLRVQMYNNGNNIITDPSGTAIIPNNTNWHMVTVTVDLPLASANMVIYVDGASVLTKNKTATAGTSNNAQFTMAIGDDQGGDGNMYGLLDEISIWNRVLTPTEITSLYNSGNGASMGWSERA